MKMTFQEIRIIATGPCIANQLRDVNTIVKTIESTAVNYFESNNILGELQGAFRKVRRLEDHIFTQNGICSLAKSLTEIGGRDFLLISVKAAFKANHGV